MSLRGLLSVGIWLAGSLPMAAQQPADHGVEYVGGRWFNGTRFIDTTIFVAGGVFRARGTARVDSVVDLRGAFVVPPFGDAHQHLVNPDINATVQAFLRDGIFYVKDQSNAPVMRQFLNMVLNKPTTFDYISANQAWTSPGGHPVEVVKRGEQMPGPLGVFVRDSLDPGLVMQVETEADVDKRWPYFLAGKPDFVKVYLFRSDEHARIAKDPKYDGNRGIDPALVAGIVRRAHAAGLQVSAHVWTAADFRAAIDAGVDQIAHMPGGKGNNPTPFLLTAADASRAAARRVPVITTVTQHGDSAVTDLLLKTQYVHNIGILRAQKVPLLIGSDQFEGTAATEVAALARSGAFTNLELLQLWSVATPQAIFPNRRIGSIADGYEANFLVLSGDPLADFRNTRRITMRVKRGLPISPGNQPGGHGG